MRSYWAYVWTRENASEWVNTWLDGGWIFAKIYGWDGYRLWHTFGLKPAFRPFARSEP